jgi:predicted NBD/HSP70 family sugar kinase
MHEFKELFVDREAPAGRVVRAIAATGAVSATQLVKSTGLARSTVSTVLTDLKDRGIVLEGETRSAGFGRPTQMVALNPKQGFCGGVLLGLGEIRVALCDLAHTVVSDLWFEMPRDYTPNDAATRVRDQLEKECDKLGINISDLLGVGLAVSAPVSYEGQILNGSILPTWCGIDIGEVFSSEIDCPIYAENESHCGALAEMTWGAAVGEPNFVLFKFDLGIGGAVVIDGAVHRGAFGNAAEFGHISLNPHGPLCRCGNRGCLETYAGGFNLIRLVEQATGERISIEAFVERAHKGEPAYKRLIEDAAEMAGWGMGITSTILSPPLFVIAGKLASIGEVFMTALERNFAKHAVRPPVEAPHMRNPRLVVGKFLGNDDTVLGAVALVLHQHGRVTEHSRNVG